MMYGNGYNGFNSCWGFASRWMHGGPAMMLMMTVFLILAAAVVIILMKKTNKRQAGSEALEMLQMRFVKGEISAEEFSRRKSMLE